MTNLLGNWKKLTVKVKEFARLVKVTPSSITNQVGAEEVSNNLAIIAALMGKMAEHGIDYWAVFEKMDIKPNKSKNKGRVIKKD